MSVDCVLNNIRSSQYKILRSICHIYHEILYRVYKQNCIIDRLCVVYISYVILAYNEDLYISSFSVHLLSHRHCFSHHHHYLRHDKKKYIYIYYLCWIMHHADILNIHILKLSDIITQMLVQTSIWKRQIHPNNFIIELYWTITTIIHLLQ